MYFFKIFFKEIVSIYFNYTVNIDNNNVYIIFFYLGGASNLTADHIDILVFLMKASIMLDEGVAPVLLQLLQSAVCGSKMVQQTGTNSNTCGSPTKRKKDKDSASGSNTGKISNFIMFEYSSIIYLNFHLP